MTPGNVLLPEEPMDGSCTHEGIKGVVRGRWSAAGSYTCPCFPFYMSLLCDKQAPVNRGGHGGGVLFQEEQQGALDGAGVLRYPGLRAELCPVRDPVWLGTVPVVGH